MIFLKNGIKFIIVLKCKIGDNQKHLLDFIWFLFGNIRTWKSDCCNKPFGYGVLNISLPR